MLRPIKSKELLVSTAMELNLPVSVVTTIAQEYWREVRESLSDLKQDRVHVTNLGDFTIKHWKLDNTIDMLQKTKIKYPEQEHLDEYIKKMEMLKGMMAEEQQRKELLGHGGPLVAFYTVPSSTKLSFMQVLLCK